MPTRNQYNYWKNTTDGEPGKTWLYSSFQTNIQTPATITVQLWDNLLAFLIHTDTSGIIYYAVRCFQEWSVWLLHNVVAIILKTESQPKLISRVTHSTNIQGHTSIISSWPFAFATAQSCLWHLTYTVIRIAKYKYTHVSKSYILHFVHSAENNCNFHLYRLMTPLTVKALMIITWTWSPVQSPASLHKPPAWPGWTSLQHLHHDILHTDNGEFQIQGRASPLNRFIINKVKQFK